ncbi:MULTISPECIES: cytochrome b/b6 domain-containing protein [Pelosinus]|uniref:Di-heme cytochrome, transmembrane n=1 Tax=Pelosinus fermentans B4 TaxID=1149862 RepID=I9LHL1_9FIRM|nr:MULTISPECIES: cytochrome b/b6 domain-containing protein [Pelosinus]EIW19999.1 Di-heme cytochrome, transmembrane [Pelosinus fermentans B4]EIW21520.1 (Ni/Fe) hydrogenase, b-type cytochrome subunit [Pelosinus fermentans A11]OAM95079.1 Di-heme cytochrome, transmembrane [Pelosinus fermentans DSM 17108]SDR22989.1 Ni/Fe-hydrogenase 1 B-type cytochrome subunit [Pelosinus fermentans]
MKLLLYPLPIRLFHWVMSSAVIVLLFTGLYMDDPWSRLQLPMEAVRKTHTLFSSILIVNLVGHLYYYLYTNRITEILILPRDWVNVPSFMRYVFFISEGHPNFGRYNPGQKLIFSLWFLAVIIVAITGSAMLYSGSSQWLQWKLGGLNAIRMLHYSVAIFFAMSIPLHLYLVFTESPANLQAMFTGYIHKEMEVEAKTNEPKDLLS